MSTQAQTQTDPDQARTETRTCRHCGLVYEEMFGLYPQTNWRAVCPRCQIRNGQPEPSSDGE